MYFTKWKNELNARVDNIYIYMASDNGECPCSIPFAVPRIYRVHKRTVKIRIVAFPTKVVAVGRITRIETVETYDRHVTRNFRRRNKIEKYPKDERVGVKNAVNGKDRGVR